MELGKILYGRLSGDAGVSAIAGSRIYPQVIPQETDRPAIAYDFTLNDAVDGNAPVLSASVQVGCWAKTNDAAHNLAAAALAALRNYAGASGGTRLAPLQFSGQSESQDVEFDVWGVVLSFRSLVVVG